MSRTTFRPRIEALEDRLALSTFTPPAQAAAPNHVVVLSGYGLGAEQAAPSGSASSGSEAGKTSFHPFSVTRPVDKANPLLLEGLLGAQGVNGSGSGGHTPVEFLPHGTLGTHTTPPAQHTGHGQTSTQSTGYTPTPNPTWDQPPARMM